MKQRHASACFSFDVIPFDFFETRLEHFELLMSFSIRRDFFSPKNEGGDQNGSLKCLSEIKSQQKRKELFIMKKSNIKTFEELPYFINAQELADILGIAISSCYELMHEKDFPTIRIGKRLVVPKDKFLIWVNENTKGGNR